MTEAEWLMEGDPRPMLRLLQSRYGATERASGWRKLRLLACACLLDAEALGFLLSGASRAAAEVAARYCEGLATEAELAEAAAGCQPEAACACAQEYECDSNFSRTVGNTSFGVALSWADYASFGCGDGLPPHSRELQHKLRQHVAWLNDIFGNPFRPVTFLPEWRTSTVLSLAQQMYESRDFAAMPILADALGDAGCEDDAILNHCRGPRPHVRGCWVRDLVLGKE